MYSARPLLPALDPNLPEPQPDDRAKPLHEPVVLEEQISIGVSRQDPRKSGEPGAKLFLRSAETPRAPSHQDKTKNT
jgi:hypothetical protein